MIEVKDLVKDYGRFRALGGVSFAIGEGEIVGLLGPNGAGKTTLLRAITGYFEPTSGSVAVDGIDAVAEPLRAQAHIGYLPEGAPLYPDMLVQEYLTMMAELRGVPVGAVRARLSEAVHSTGLERRLTQNIGSLSKGFRQRVGLAQAILHQPRFLILDEPTSGLDPTQIAEVRNLVHRLARTSTVILSTHILPEVEQTCERVLILMNGHLQADAALAELTATNEVYLAVPAGTTGVAETLAALPEIQAVAAVEGREGYDGYQLSGEADVDLCRIAYGLARQRDWELGELRPSARTLETVFGELALKQGVQA